MLKINFRTLYDQQGSRWTLQATRMDGDIGFMDIKPDQIQFLNPFLILIFIPLYEVAFYPVLNLLGVRRPLQKLTLGMILAGVAFMISFTLEWQLMKTYPVLPKGNEGHVRIYNTIPCNYKVDGFQETFDLKSLTLSPNLINVLDEKDTERSTLRFVSTDAFCKPFTGAVDFKRHDANGYYLTGTSDAPRLAKFLDNPDKTKNGNPRVRVLSNVGTDRTILIEGDRTMEIKAHNTTDFDLPKGGYSIKVKGNEVGYEDFKLGGVYAILMYETITGKIDTSTVIVSEPNSVSILWIIPQYLVMTLGEVMFSVTGISFSFDEAPQSMKSVLNGCWQLTSAFGNIIIVIIAELPLFGDQVSEGI